MAYCGVDPDLDPDPRLWLMDPDPGSGSFCVEKWRIWNSFIISSRGKNIILTCSDIKVPGTMIPRRFRVYVPASENHFFTFCAHKNTFEPVPVLQC